MDGFYFNKRQYQVATSAKEMSGRQIGLIFWLSGFENVPVNTLRYLILIVLTCGLWDRICLFWLLRGPAERPRAAVSRWISRIFWPEIVIQPDRDDLLLLTDFVFQRDFRLTEQKLPVLRVGRHRLYGPTDQMRSITFAQFYNAEAWYWLYRNTKDPKWLQELANVLYLRKGESWTTEDDPNAESRLRICARLKPWQLLYILTFYDGCRSYLLEKYPIIFPKPSSGGPKKHPNPRKIRDDWRINIRQTIAKDFASLPVVDSSSVYQVMDHLQHSIEESERIKEYWRKNSPKQ